MPTLPLGSNYQLVFAHDNQTGRPGRLILDTNVAIDIERFYFGTLRSASARADLERLLKDYAVEHLRPSVDINYGFACLEASWTRGTGVDAIKKRTLLHSVGRVLSWDSEHIERAFHMRRAPVDRDKEWPRKVPLPAVSEDDHPAHLLVGSYGSLLYMNLAARESGRTVKALRAYLEWLRDSLGVRGAYEVQLGLDFFLGDSARRSGVQHLLRIGGSESSDTLADRCWNAAWDLLFLRLTEGGTYGIQPVKKNHGGPVVLVTRNLDPGFVRAASEVRGLIRMPSPTGDVVFTQVDWSQHPRLELDQVSDLLGATPTHADALRMTRDPAEMANQAFSATRELECRLGVTRSALPNEAG
jgi:hypothetical protein